MPPVNYFELGGDRQLNEIVFAGSHDAGITSGKDNVKTQSLDIRGQAQAGVRIFDLRVAAATTGGKFGEHKPAELKAFHADSKLMKNETKTRHLEDVGRVVTIERTKLKGGAFGMGLMAMLEDAKAFVQSDAGKSEFLLLKFDKCTNWELIAEACIEGLGTAIFTGAVNLNTAKLKDLSGKVVVLFPLKVVTSLAPHFHPGNGIISWANLAGGGSYDRDFKGLQYYGKGGTTLNPLKNKIEANVKKQGKLMKEAKAFGMEEVIRMMYWTSTGLTESIEARNDRMWLDPNVAKMKKLWKEGLEEYVEHVNPLALPEGSPAIGPTRKRYMPNIVMVDFADEAKCKIIRELNDLTPEQIAQL